jgi:hypothetical protein
MTLASRLSALAQAVGADIKGLNTLLGANPQGTAASVAARLANIEAGNTPASPHGLTVYRAANLVLATGTLATISWDTVLADNADGNWSAANPTRLTALKAGWYTFNARILYPANATGQRTFQWAVNGNTVAREDHNAPSNAASNVAFSSSVTVYLAVGDYLELKVSQNSGASLTVAGATAATPYQLSLSMAPHMGLKGDKGDKGDPSTSTGAGVEVYRAATMSVASGAWVGPVSFDTLRFDNTNGEWDVSTPTRMTCKKTGWYMVHGACIYPANTTGRRVIGLKVNGNFVARDDRPAVNVGTDEVQIANSWPLYLTAGDYVELWLHQDSGAALTVPSAISPYSLALGMVPTQGSKGDKGDPASVVHGVSVRRTTTLAVPTATWTTVAFDQLVADNADGQWAAAASDRLTAKVAGWYTVVGTLLWPGPNGTGRRLMGLTVNGVGSVQRGDLDPNASATDQMHTEAFLVYLNAGDYVGIQAYQDSGSTLTLTATWPQLSMAPHQGSPGPAGSNTLRQQRINVPAFSSGNIVFPVDGSRDLGWKLDIVGQIAAVTAAKYPYVELNGLAAYWNQAIEHYVYINGGAATHNVQAVKAGSGGAGFGFVLAELGLNNVLLDLTAELILNATPAPNIDAAGNIATTGLEFSGIAKWMIRAPAGTANFEGGETYNSVEYQQQQLAGGIKSLLLNWDGASFKGDVILTPLLS